jgi:hypothetical protein
VLDVVGSAHGEVVGGAELSLIAGKGVLVLGGGTSGSYVSLPNGMISSLSDASFEMWVTWGGGNAWQRLFDFGDSSATPPEDMPATGKSYLFLTPMSPTASGSKMRAVYSLAGSSEAAETRLDATLALTPLQLAHVVLVVDATSELVTLYVDGAENAQVAFTGALSSINDVNVWLGRSQFQGDPELAGTYHEFRIYDAALTAAQVATSFAAGPDPAFLSP